MQIKELETCKSVRLVENCGDLLKFAYPQDYNKVNPKLLADLACAAVALGFCELKISSAITGHREFTETGRLSRHVKGNAVDISHIDGFSVKGQVGKALAGRLVRFLLNQGYVLNRENGNTKAVLWLSRGHYDHIHVSRID